MAAWNPGCRPGASAGLHERGFEVRHYLVNHEERETRLNQLKNRPVQRVGALFHEGVRQGEELKNKRNPAWVKSIGFWNLVLLFFFIVIFFHGKDETILCMLCNASWGLGKCRKCFKTGKVVANEKPSHVHMLRFYPLRLMTHDMPRRATSPKAYTGNNLLVNHTVVPKKGGHVGFSHSFRIMLLRDWLPHL